MSISEAKLDANRANAQHSTGPKTEEGKSRSAQNSFKHGFTAKNLIVAEDEQETFDALHEGLRTEVRPQGCVEETLFSQLLHATWNLHRVKEIEANLFAKGDIDDPQTGKALDRLMRYQRLHTSNYHKAFKALTEQQTRRLTLERIGHTIAFDATEIFPLTADPDKIRRATHKAYEAMQSAMATHGPAPTGSPAPPVQ